MLHNWGRRRFAIRIALVVGIFLAATIGFPFFIATITAGCSSCGAAWLFWAALLKPPMFWIFILALLPPLIGRLRDVGVTPWLSAYFVGLILLDSAALVFVGAGWGYAVSMGVIEVGPPLSFLTAVLAMAGLACMPARQHRVSLLGLGPRKWGLVAVAVILLLASANSWFGLQMASVVGPRVYFGLRSVFSLSWYFIPVTAVALLWSLWPVAGEASDVDQSSRWPQLPLKSILLAALATSSVVTFFTAPNPSIVTLLFLPNLLLPTILPNALLLSVLFLTAYLWRRGFHRPALGLSVVLIGIYGSWAYQHYFSDKISEMDAQTVASLETYRPPVMPRAVLLNVLEPYAADYARIFLDMDDFDLVMFSSKTGLVGYRYEVVTPTNGGTRNGTKLVSYELDTLPSQYLELNRGELSGQRETFDPKITVLGGGPYQLNYVDGADTKLVAAWNRRKAAKPLWVPILTQGGWMEIEGRGINTIRDSEAIAELMAAARGDAAGS